jgi:two-component system, OmpR family, copper resistance phosphate regulon response regulator CusR
VRVLIVSAQSRHADQLTRLLESHNFTVEHADAAGQALLVLDAGGVSACLIDADLADGTGLDLLCRLRAEDHGTPTLYFLPEESVPRRVEALDLGADDVMAWPPEPQVLLAQVRSLLRRCNGGASAVLRYEDLRLDLRSLKVLRDGRAIRATSREIAVLEYLLRNPERVVVRSELIDAVWDRSLPPESNVVEVFIARLRRKIDRPFKRQLIHTIVGRGYVLARTKPGDDPD